MTPGINPIYAELERSCPRDSKNVSYVDVGHRTGLDLIESCEWWVGLGINLVNSPFCNHNSSIHIFFHTLHLC